MREIKFRARIRNYGLMIMPEDINVMFVRDGKITSIETEEHDIDIDTFDLMQYTGLKDSKGNEIYEGDIVRVWEDDEMIPERDSGGGIIDFNRYEGYSQLGVVSYKGAWFAYETKKHLEGRKEQIFAPLDFHGGIEIVGNIYENKDLLK